MIIEKRKLSLEINYKDRQLKSLRNTIFIVFFVKIFILITTAIRDDYFKKYIKKCNLFRFLLLYYITLQPESTFCINNE